jgi:hypothetical protein
MRKLIFTMAICLTVSSASAARPQSSDPPKEKPQGPTAACPMHDAHTKMNERGQKGMGFSQEASKHHFLLKADGGVIQVEVDDAADTVNRDNIRMHLTHIARAFAGGDFDIPMFVHDTVPPGVPEMKRLQEKIRYSFEETPKGGRVVIATTDEESRAAIHKFLKFQIEEHKTGDSIKIP